jgi:type VI secretion system secreted protein VgrG
LTERVFPAGIETKPEAQASAHVRLAARISGAQSCSGESTYLQLQAGTRVYLTGHPRVDFNQEYVITAVEHQRTGKEYRNTFRCLPAQVVYRPQLLTQTPVVAGVVSGLVVGPQGETRHVDQFGRVKVRFPWRSPAFSVTGEQGDAGFVRVAQIATGAGASAMWLPDVGDEVLVAFEYGDPRRPVVVGSVYNAKDMPPVALPANKHLSLLRQQGPGGVNEFVFDGTLGKEKLVVQGASVIVRSGGDLLQRAGRSLVMDAAADLSIRAAQNLSIVSQGNGALTVAGNSQFTTGGDAQWSVGKNLQSSIGSSAVMDIAKDLSIRAGQNYLLQVQRMVRVIAGDDTVIQSGKSLVANVGGLFQFVAAQTGTIQAARGLLLRSEGDIDIIGKDIDAKASGNLTLKGAKILQN